MYLYICRQSLGMQFSYPKNKSVMNKIRDGLLKESRFNILSKKRDNMFCIVNKRSICCYFYFKSQSEKAIVIPNSLDFWIKLIINSLDFWINIVSLHCKSIDYALWMSDL